MDPPVVLSSSHVKSKMAGTFRDSDDPLLRFRFDESPSLLTAKVGWMSQISTTRVPLPTFNGDSITLLASIIVLSIAK